MANRRFIDFPIASTVGDNDIILIWQDGLNKQTTKATLLSGLPEDLADLNDVVISGLTNGQILRYNSTTGVWENTDQGNLDLNDLNDVTIVSPSNGQVLVYNSSTSQWENSSGGYVPYVGAVTTVDLGAQGLRAGYVRFDTTVASVPDEQGLMYWDGSRSTVALIMNGTLQHIGQDSFFYVKNSTGSSINKGVAVRFDGTDGASGHLKIAPFLADGTYPSTYFMGVTAEAIGNGEFGQVMHFGELEGINTSGFTAGDLLYASTTVAGGFQTTAPVAPNNIVLIAAAINSKNNGAIIVRPTYGSNINNDEGVKLTSVADKNLLQYQSGTGLWENKTLAQVIGSDYVPSTRNITINGTTQDLSADRTYNVGTVTSVGLSSATSGVTIGSSPVTTSGTITLAIATASGSQNGLLSSTDWTTFNNKQNALTNPVTGTGTTNYLPKFTGSTTIGNSATQTDATGNLMVGSANAGNAGTINVSVGAAGTTAGGLQLWAATNQTHFIQFGDGTTGAQVYAGYMAYAHGTDSLLFGTNGGDKMTLNSSGNLGIGVTPSAWSLGKAIEIGNIGNSVWGVNTTQFNVLQNVYYDGGGFKYATSNAASYYQQASGAHAWYTAPSGTAGNAITFTPAMTLTSGGSLLVGGTTDNGAKLQVSGGVTTMATITSSSTASGLQLTNSGGTASSWIIQSDGGAVAGQEALRFYSLTASAYRMSIDGSGNVGIGTTSPSYPLTISAVTANTAFYNTFSNAANRNWAIAFGIGSLGDFNIMSSNAEGGNPISAGTSRLNIQSNGNVGIGTTSPASILQIQEATPIFTLNQTTGNSNQGIYFNINGTNYGRITNNAATGLMTIQNGLNSGDGYSIRFITDGSERLRITSSGNVLIGSPPAADNGARLQVSGTATFSGSITGSSNSNTFGNASLSGRAVIIQAGITNQAIMFKNSAGGDGTLYINGTSNTVDYNFNTYSVGDALVIKNSGNVGIGTSSPSNRLDILGTAASPTLVGTNAYARFYQSGGYANVTIGALASGSFAGWIQTSDGVGTALPLSLQPSGANLLVGTTTDNGARLQVSGTATLSSAGSVIPLKILNTTGTTLDMLVLETGWNNPSGNKNIIWKDETNTLGRISVSYDAGTGSTMRFGSLYNGGYQSSDLLTIASTGAATFSSLGTGTVYSNGGTLTNTNPSDFNLKKNIAPINYGLSEILQLNPVTFSWKNDTINQGKQYGFIAQEIQKIMPDLVKKGEYLGLDKEAIFTTLVKAIQELKQEIDTLKN